MIEEKHKKLRPGTKLKELRKEKGISLEEVSENTKIPIDKLKAIEANVWGYFSNEFYAKSFLRKYSDFLGVPAEDVKIFEDNGAVPPASQIQDTGISRKTVITLICAAIIAALIICGLLYMSARQKRIKLEETLHKETISMPANTTIMVIAITTKPTWVRVICDGKLKEEAVLDAGVQNRWDARKTLKIRISNIEGIDIYYFNISEDGYRKIDIHKGSVGKVNEIEFVTEFSK